MGKFAVTEVNRNQKIHGENLRKVNEMATDEARLRHSDDRRSRKFDFDIEKRRANNDYQIHEHLNRRARSERIRRSFDKNKLINQESVKPDELSEKVVKRNFKIEDLSIDVNGFSKLGQFWDFDDTGSPSGVFQTQDDYFGDYEIEDKPEKRSNFLSYNDLLRMKRDLTVDDEYNDNADDYGERREKREEEESKCDSEVTTLNVGCSTADRMEFQSDCVDENNAITGKLII